MTEDKLLAIIDEQNTQIAELESRISTQRRVIDGYDKAHAHEKRELWMSLRDKYACAVVGGFCADTNISIRDVSVFAKRIFEIADALMVERDAEDEIAVPEEHTTWDNSGGRD